MAKGLTGTRQNPYVDTIYPDMSILTLTSVQNGKVQQLMIKEITREGEFPVLTADLQWKGGGLLLQTPWLQSGVYWMGTLEEMGPPSRPSWSEETTLGTGNPNDQSDTEQEQP